MCVLKERPGDRREYAPATPSIFPSERMAL